MAARRLVRGLAAVTCIATAVSCAELTRLQQERPAPEPLFRHGGTNRPLMVPPYGPPPRPEPRRSKLNPAQPRPPAAEGHTHPAQPPVMMSQQAVATGASAAGWRLIGAPRRHELAHGAWLHEATVTDGRSTANIEAVVFDSRACTLRVLDQPMPSAGGSAIHAVMHRQNAIAGVNGGFFDSEFRPLGVMIAGGRKTGSFTANRLISGSVLTVGREPYLVWNAEFAGEKGVTDLIQSGPRLVDSGKPVPKLNRTQQATRTFVATDGKRGWVIGLVRSTSLGSLGDLLASPGIVPGIRIHRALNLDGGRSSALWARTAGGREISKPGWSTVRNYLAVVAR